jgi:phospholipid/cholesterol/gamma-HCH transport system ATP-binding protein
MPLLSPTLGPPPSTPEAKPASIAFEDVAIAFEGKQVLDGISFQLARGETKVLLGVSGSGKTTILKMVLGLVKPDRGTIFVLGQEVTRMQEEDLFDLRRNLGMVFQESALFDSLTVRENVAYRLMEEHNIPEDEREQRVREALCFVDLENTLHLMPAELSGGMRRRVAIARAMISRPEVLLYDSPTAGLDPVTSTNIIELVVKQRDLYHTSSLMVTHRLQDAAVMAAHYFDPDAKRMLPVEPGARPDANTTFLLLRAGAIVFDGPAAELARDPDPYIRNYIG